MGETSGDVFALGPELLWDLGFRDLTRSQVTDALDEIYYTLELRVGSRLAEGLDANQLATFERLVDRGDDAGASKWLSDNKPEYRRVVRDELDHIVSSLRRAANYSQAILNGAGDSMMPPGLEGEARETGVVL